MSYKRVARENSDIFLLSLSKYVPNPRVSEMDLKFCDPVAVGSVLITMCVSNKKE